MTLRLKQLSIDWMERARDEHSLIISIFHLSRKQDFARLIKSLSLIPAHVVYQLRESGTSLCKWTLFQGKKCLVN